MKILFEIMLATLPAIITGFASFIITKYMYNNNKPLDKLEIAYNRVYYPICLLIRNENIGNYILIEKIKFYITKYHKYTDVSTLKSFNYLVNCKSKRRRKAAYLNLKNNILNKSSYLRRRLGYLEPNIFQIYTYSSPSEKSTVRLFFEFSCMYLLLILSGAAKANNKLQLFLLELVLLLLLIIILETLLKFVRFLVYKFIKK